MKRIIFLILSSVFLYSSCSITRTSGHRLPAFDNREESCNDYFKKGTERLSEIIAKSPAFLSEKLIQSYSSNTKTILIQCKNEKISPYGVRYIKTQATFEIEENLSSTADLFEGDNALVSENKYGIELRAVSFLQIMTGLNAHLYTEAAGVDDSKYEVFYRTIKYMQIKNH